MANTKKGRIIEIPNHDFLLKAINTIPSPQRRIISLSNSPEVHESNSYLSLHFNSQENTFVVGTLQMPLRNLLANIKINDIDFHFNSPNEFEILKNEYLQRLVKQDYQIVYARLELVNPQYPQYKSHVKISESRVLEVRLSELDSESERIRKWLENLEH